MYSRKAQYVLLRTPDSMCMVGLKPLVVQPLLHVFPLGRVSLYVAPPLTFIPWIYIIRRITRRADAPRTFTYSRIPHLRLHPCARLEVLPVVSLPYFSPACWSEPFLVLSSMRVTRAAPPFRSITSAASFRFIFWEVGPIRLVPGRAFVRLISGAPFLYWPFCHTATSHGSILRQASSHLLIFLIVLSQIPTFCRVRPSRSHLRSAPFHE